MASSNCWRCLSRPAASLTTLNGSLTSLSLFRPAAAATFSTTAHVAVDARMAARSAKDARGEKGKKTLRIKKKVVVKSGKPPAQGERKAMRKRIVLSNTNALEVAGLRDLDGAVVDKWLVEEDAVLDGALISAGEAEEEVTAGKVVGLSGETVDSLRACEAFKTTQGWGLFRRPALLVREEGVELSRKMLSQKEGLRLVVDGEKGGGKSVLLLHAMATAFVKGWVVLHIPEAQEITNAVNDYAPIPGTNPTLWAQNTYTANWLGQIHKANAKVLENLTMKSEHSLPISVPPKTTLARLCELGARDPDAAWPVFQAFWAELTAAKRPPVLMSLDSVTHVLQNSLYRAPDASFIHSHDLALVRHFITYLSGTAKLPNGGAVIAATNRSHAPVSMSLDLAIKNFQEKEAGQALTPRDPFQKKYDARADEVLKGVEIMKLGGLSKEEARELMEYWAKSGVLRSRVDEETVAEKWALAGNGIVGEIQRGSLWMRI